MSFKYDSPIGKWNKTTIRDASFSQPKEKTIEMVAIDSPTHADSQASFDSLSLSTRRKVQEDWWNVGSPFYKRWEKLRQFRSVALESQLVRIISRIIEFSRSVKYDTPPSYAYSLIENMLVIDTIQLQLNELKRDNPEIEENINRINGKSNVIDVSHDLTKVYIYFLNILHTVQMDGLIKTNLIAETTKLLNNISSSQSTKFVPEKGHTEFKKLINELINYLLDKGVRFNKFSLEPTAVIRDDIKLVIPQDLECFSESGSKEITGVRLDGRLCTNADCGSGTAHLDMTNPIQVCTFPNIFNAVSYRMTSTLGKKSITHEIIAYVKTDDGLFFEVYVYDGGVSLNSVVELIRMLGMLDERFVTDIKCALRSCGDKSDEQYVKSNISELGSYYVSDTSVIQQLVEFFMDESDESGTLSAFSGLDKENKENFKLTDLSQYLTQAFCCRAGLKTIGDLSSRVVIQKGGYSSTEQYVTPNVIPKVFGTVDKFCGESCLMWVLSGYISGLEYICMKSKKNYEVYKIPKNDSESLKKNLSFIYIVDLVKYQEYCISKYLTFINTAVRALGERKKTTFESIQYKILKIIQTKYKNRIKKYFKHLINTKDLVKQTVDGINNGSVILNEVLTQNISNISNMLLKLPDESYINPSFDINELLNEYTMFSELGSTELQYKLDSKNIKNFQGYIELKRLLTDHIRDLKITKNMVEQSLDIFTTLYIQYNHTDDKNRGTFIDFFNQNVRKLPNEYNNSICLTLLNKVGETKIIGIIKSYIGYIQESLTTEPVANQATFNVIFPNDEEKSLFYFFVGGTITKTRYEPEIKFNIVEDDITFNINNRLGLTSFFNDIGLPKNRISSGVFYNIDDDVTNWTICEDKLTIPVTIELLLNLKEYIRKFEYSNNIKKEENDGKIKIINNNIIERVDKIIKKIHPKLAVEQEELQIMLGERGRGTTKQYSERDRSRSRSKGGGRKPHKSVTRRKTKKSPKRKTIKKRKMPKRNAKTRRQRK